MKQLSGPHLKPHSKKTNKTLLIFVFLLVSISILAILLHFIPLSTTSISDDCGQNTRFTIISLDNDPTYSKAAYDQIRNSGEPALLTGWCTSTYYGPSQARLYLF